ncbi:unnamed protein product [Arctogadus glacialis]
MVWRWDSLTVAQCLYRGGATGGGPEDRRFVAGRGGCVKDALSDDRAAVWSSKQRLMVWCAVGPWELDMCYGDRINKGGN